MGACARATKGKGETHMLLSYVIDFFACVTSRMIFDTFLFYILKPLVDAVVKLFFELPDTPKYQRLCACENHTD